MLEESGILDEGNGEDDEYMEVDNVVVMAQSDGSDSVPSASVSDKEDSVNNLATLVVATVVVVSVAAKAVATVVVVAVAATVAAVVIAAATVVVALAATVVATVAAATVVVVLILAIVGNDIHAVLLTMPQPPIPGTSKQELLMSEDSVWSRALRLIVTAGLLWSLGSSLKLDRFIQTFTAAAVTTATVTTAATITTTTATVGSTSTTTVATAATNSGTGTTVRPVYPKFGLFQFSEPVGPTQVLPASATAIKFFMQIFDDSLFRHVADQTNLYVSQVTSRSARYGWYDTTVTEMKAFVGVLLLMGIHHLTSIADYWSTHKYLGVPTISAVFPANRFNRLLASIHFNDNSNAKPRGHPEYDKLYKIRPVMKSILQKRLSLYNPH